MRAITVFACAAASSVALAGPPSRPARPPATLRVTGQAKLSEAPNRVYVDIGVTTQAPNSQAAAAQNADRLRAVVAAIKRTAGPGGHLTTRQYLVTPNYQAHADGKPPTIVGFTATNMVRVRLDNLGAVARVIDAATQAGANRIGNIRFTLRNSEAAKTEALREAARNSREEARALANALDLRIVRIVSVDEASPVIVPTRALYALATTRGAARATTPIESGTLNVDARVTLTAEVAPRRGDRAQY